jgi:hypothetical protein
MFAPFALPPSFEFPLPISYFRFPILNVRSAQPSTAQVFVDTMLNASDFRPTSLVQTAFMVPRHYYIVSVIWTTRITICR